MKYKFPSHMIRISYFIILLALITGLAACSEKQSERVHSTEEGEQLEQKRDSLVEEIEIHPADSTVMEQEAEKTASDSLPIVSIQKGSCYGNCPVYEASLYKDGRAEYIGKRYVDRIGTYRAQMDSVRIADIYEKVAFIDYFSLNERYPEDNPPISDLPNTITTVRKDGMEQTIVNNSGAPRELKDFEQYLERTFNRLDWKPVSSSDTKD